MADRQEDGPFTVGAAVRFVHRGRTVEGHLLRRQGRRRLATVIDTRERLWKVPEAALTPSDGPRRTTLVTRQDEARAAWRVGDRVAFAQRDGPRRGRIVKLNPTRAKVRSGGVLWNVPYALLSGAEPGGTGRRRPPGARNGAARLAHVAAMARALMDEHGLADWTFAFLEAERRLGDCHFEDRVIRLGPRPRTGRQRGRDRGHRAARDRPRPRRPRGPPRARVESHRAAHRRDAPRQRLRAPGAVTAGR